MQQAWAQALQAFDSGARWYLTPDENRIIAARNDHFKSHSKVDDLLAAGYEPNATPDRHLNVTEIMREVGIVNPHKSELNEAAQWLRGKGFEEKKRNGKRGFMMPILTTIASGAFSNPVVIEGGKK